MADELTYALITPYSLLRAVPEVYWDVCFRSQTLSLWGQPCLRRAMPLLINIVPPLKNRTSNPHGKRL